MQGILRQQVVCQKVVLGIAQAGSTPARSSSELPNQKSLRTSTRTFTGAVDTAPPYATTPTSALRSCRLKYLALRSSIVSRVIPPADIQVRDSFPGARSTLNHNHGSFFPLEKDRASLPDLDRAVGAGRQQQRRLGVHGQGTNRTDMRDELLGYRGLHQLPVEDASCAESGELIIPINYPDQLSRLIVPIDYPDWLSQH